MEKLTQTERDIKLYNEWQQRLMDCEKGADVARRQIAYLAQFIVQDTLTDLGMAWAEKRDAEFNQLRAENA